MDYDPIKRKLNETWKLMEKRDLGTNLTGQPIERGDNPMQAQQQASIDSGKIPPQITTYHGHTYTWDGEYWVNDAKPNDIWDFAQQDDDGTFQVINQPSGSVPPDAPDFFETEDKVTEVTKAEHEDNMARVMAAQGTTSRTLGGEESRMLDYARNWAVEHEHEGFDPYDILYLSPNNIAVYNTREPDPKTGRSGSYYILGQDLFVSADEVRQLTGRNKY